MSDSIEDSVQPLTTDELRAAAENWTLADDVGLLAHLQQFSKKIIDKAEKAEASVHSLENSLEEACTQFSNVSNRFASLQNSQFIENRVYDDDTPTNDEVIKPAEKELTKQETFAKYKEAVVNGLTLLDTHFEAVEVLASSDSDEEPSDSTQMLRAKTAYAKPLPLLIGSAEWWADDNVGIGEFIENVESEPDLSDSEPDPLRPDIETRVQISSSTPSVSSIDTPVVSKKPTEPTSSRPPLYIPPPFPDQPPAFVEQGGDDLFEEDHLRRGIFDDEPDDDLFKTTSSSTSEKKKKSEDLFAAAAGDDERASTVAVGGSGEMAAPKTDVSPVPNAFTRELAAKLGTVLAKTDKAEKREEPWPGTISEKASPASQNATPAVPSQRDNKSKVLPAANTSSIVPSPVTSQPPVSSSVPKKVVTSQGNKLPSVPSKGLFGQSSDDDDDDDDDSLFGGFVKPKPSVINKTAEINNQRSAAVEKVKTPVSTGGAGSGLFGDLGDDEDDDGDDWFGGGGSSLFAKKPATSSSSSQQIRGHGIDASQSAQNVKKSSGLFGDDLFSDDLDGDIFAPKGPTAKEKRVAAPFNSSMSTNAATPKDESTGSPALPPYNLRTSTPAVHILNNPALRQVARATMSDSLSPVGNASAVGLNPSEGGEQSSATVEDYVANDSRDNAIYLDVESRDLGFIESSSILDEPSKSNVGDSKNSPANWFHPQLSSTRDPTQTNDSSSGYKTHTAPFTPYSKSDIEKRITPIQDETKSRSTVSAKSADLRQNDTPDLFAPAKIQKPSTSKKDDLFASTKTVNWKSPSLFEEEDDGLFDNGAKNVDSVSISSNRSSLFEDASAGKSSLSTVFSSKSKETKVPSLFDDVDDDFDLFKGKADSGTAEKAPEKSEEVVSSKEIDKRDGGKEKEPLKSESPMPADLVKSREREASEKTSNENDESAKPVNTLKPAETVMKEKSEDDVKSSVSAPAKGVSEKSPSLFSDAPNSIKTKTSSSLLVEAASTDPISSETKELKKDGKNSTSLFSDSDPNEPVRTEKRVSSEKKLESESKLFSSDVDDLDLFAPKPSSVLKNSAKVEKPPKGLFDDDDDLDLFSSRKTDVNKPVQSNLESKKENVTASEKPVKAPSNEDLDLFSSKKTDVSKSISTETPANLEQSSSGDKSPASKIDQKEKVSSKGKSLFTDDLDDDFDLFGGKPEAEKKHSISVKPTADSLKEDPNIPITKSSIIKEVIESNKSDFIDSSKSDFDLFRDKAKSADSIMKSVESKNFEVDSLGAKSKPGDAIIEGSDQTIGKKSIPSAVDLIGAKSGTRMEGGSMNQSELEKNISQGKLTTSSDTDNPLEPSESLQQIGVAPKSKQVEKKDAFSTVDDDLDLFKKPVKMDPAAPAVSEGVKVLPTVAKVKPPTSLNVTKASDLLRNKEKDETDGEVVKKSVGKLKMPVGLKINMAAHLPGAKLVKSQAPATEEIIPEEISAPAPQPSAPTTDPRPEETNHVLPSMSRDRARVSVKRRPQSRKARQEALRYSGIDFGEIESIDTSPIDVSTHSNSSEDGGRVDQERRLFDDEDSSDLFGQPVIHQANIPHKTGGSALSSQSGTLKAAPESVVKIASFTEPTKSASAIAEPTKSASVISSPIKLASAIAVSAKSTSAEPAMSSSAIAEPIKSAAVIAKPTESASVIAEPKLKVVPTKSAVQSKPKSSLFDDDDDDDDLFSNISTAVAPSANIVPKPKTETTVADTFVDPLGLLK